LPPNSRAIAIAISTLVQRAMSASIFGRASAWIWGWSVIGAIADFRLAAGDPAQPFAEPLHDLAGVVAVQIFCCRCSWASGKDSDV
jgi:hypothetical protein